MAGDTANMTFSFFDSAAAYITGCDELRAKSGDAEPTLLIITFPLFRLAGGGTDRRIDRATNGGPLVAVGWIARSTLTTEAIVQVRHVSLALRLDPRIVQGDQVSFDFEGELILV